MKKSTILKSILLLFIFVSFLIINNILNDPHAILHDPHKNGGWRIPNLHFLKLKHILTEPRKKIILTGTSRVNYIYFSDWIPIDQFYNLGAPRKTFAEILYDLNALKKYDKLPEYIFIGIDEGSFRLSTEENRKLKMKLPYPIDFLGYLEFYYKYFLVKDANNLEFIHRWNYNKPALQNFDIYATGETKMPLLDTMVLKDPSNWNEDIKFKLPMLLTDNNSEESLREFSELFQFLKLNDIQYTFFFNPIHKANWLSEKSNELFEFKNNLADISYYLDFSSPNTELSNNNYYWYDPAHFRSNIGTKIAFALLSHEKLIASDQTNRNMYTVNGQVDNLQVTFQEITSQNSREIFHRQQLDLDKILPH